MSSLRPECANSTKPALDSTLALRRVYYAVKKRRSLAFGQLHSGDKHCAMGCFREDNPGTILEASLIEQVAAVNDSVPPSAPPSERRRHVLRWLEWKLGL